MRSFKFKFIYRFKKKRFAAHYKSTKTTARRLYGNRAYILHKFYFNNLKITVGKMEMGQNILLFIICS